MTDKWGRRLFKTGAVALLILGAVHSISFFQKLLPANDTEKQLLNLMSNYKFNLAGSFRSMDDLMTGFSVCFMLAALGFGLFNSLRSRDSSRSKSPKPSAARMKHTLHPVITTSMLARDPARMNL